MRFPFYHQMDARDCGPACLRMIAKFYGKNYTLETLREKAHVTREGVSLMGITDSAESIGMRSIGVRISLKQLQEEAPLPCIAHWKQSHFVVVTQINRKGEVLVADPAIGMISM